MLLEFLYVYSKTDYTNIYDYLSKRYLKTHFPSVTDAEQYNEVMENKSERQESTYLEIMDWKQINKIQYSVDLILQTNAEGNIITLKMRYFFMKEETEWRYDGLDIEFMELIEDY